MNNKFRFVIIVMSALFLFVAHDAFADTDTLASGALSGGPSQSVAACYFFNAGSAPVDFVSRSIHSQFDGIIRGTFYDDCGQTLAPGDVCGTGTRINNNQGYACKTVVKGSAGRLRGIMEIRDGYGKVLANSELR